MSTPNLGTFTSPPNAYMLSILPRYNPLTHRRTPFTASAEAHLTDLQRYVNHQSNRPPNRRILQTLRILTYYSPEPDVAQEYITCLSSNNLHIVSLAHYHIRTLADQLPPDLKRQLVDELERQLLSTSPARRAKAVKTFARVCQPEEVARAIDVCADALKNIGGARALRQGEEKKRNLKKNNPEKNEKRRFDFFETTVVRGETMNDTIVRKSTISSKIGRRRESTSTNIEDSAQDVGDGMGGVTTLQATNVRSKLGKSVVAHSIFAALRRFNRLSVSEARMDSLLIDSGLVSIMPSAVRHSMALLEWRALVAAPQVRNYLCARLPNTKHPARLFLQDLGARVYYTRLCARFARDPNLKQYIPDEKTKARRKETLSSALQQKGVVQKASGLFKFLFNAQKSAIESVRSSTQSASSRALVVKREDETGRVFAEALISVLKNSSNRVLIEALRGLAKRKWTTWFEAPIPQAALYNAPELEDGELFGGTPALWDEESDAETERGNDEDELGSFEGDMGAQEEEVPDPAKPMNPHEQSKLNEVENGEWQKEEAVKQKETWFSKMTAKRSDRRQKLIDSKTPLYLQQVGRGMVPALDIILRRLYGALLQDETVRRFAATDAIIVLARARIYGQSEENQQLYSKARQAVMSSRPSSSRALMVMDANNTPTRVTPSGDRHPLQPLVRPLSDVVNEDPNQYVRARAAFALLFIIASGAGRFVSDPDFADLEVSERTIRRNAQLQETPLLLRYFRNWVTHPSAGSGVGLRLVSEFVDYLLYELLDIAPDLCESAIQLTELWAMTHPTVGVCGRLGAVWEKSLTLGFGKEVGASIFRSVESPPKQERVASAAVIFLRRRTLDLAIISAGGERVSALAEPLPRPIGVEMERYFSLLWHASLLGASAECRTFAIEALGGAAVLAGEPFRICAYERLVELVRMRGFGLKQTAARVLDCLDAIYFSRERFSEARAKNRVARDGSAASRKWLQLVWRLAAESAAAAQVLLGVPPPDGWQPLGPGAQRDVAKAEMTFGDVRDRQLEGKLKDENVIVESAPQDIPMIEDARPPPRYEDERNRGRERAFTEDYAEERYRDEARPREDDYVRRGGSRRDERSPRMDERAARRVDSWRDEAGEKEEYDVAGSSNGSTAASSKKTRGEKREETKQVLSDEAIARRMQEEEGIGMESILGTAAEKSKVVRDRAGDIASRVMKQGQKFTQKAMKSAAVASVNEKIRGRKE